MKYHVDCALVNCTHQEPCRFIKLNRWR